MYAVVNNEHWKLTIARAALFSTCMIRGHIVDGLHID
jgi:hypothetical protein